MLKEYLSIFLLLCFLCTTNCLHLTGKWNTEDFFLFVTKFGFQKTETYDHTNTLGFIYGNITSPGYVTSIKHKATFVVVDRPYFLDYYKQRLKYTVNPDKACADMFQNIENVAFDRNCNVNGSEDFLRSVPCPVGQLCEDEDQPDHVVNGHQFTFFVLNSNQARYAMLLLLYH